MSYTIAGVAGISSFASIRAKDLKDKQGKQPDQNINLSRPKTLIIWNQGVSSKIIFP